MTKTNTRNRIVSILLALVMLLTMLPTTAFAAGSAKTTDITEINLTGNYQYGNVPAGILPSFNPRTTTDSITIGRTNSDWVKRTSTTSLWGGFAGNTPVAYNDGKTYYGYRFQVKTNSGYQLASDLKVIYNGEDVTSTVEVTRWSWGAYVYVDLGKAIGENPTTHTVTFNSNGGTEIAPKEVVSGLKIEAPSTPTKKGFTFDGWYEEATLNTKFDFNTPITSNRTLYAKWEAANSINEIRLAGDFQYGTVPAGVLPAFNPRTITDSISIGSNSAWAYYKSATSVWSGFGSETPVAVNDGKTKYGYRFQVKTNSGYQLASDLKVIYNGNDVTSSVEVLTWPWGAYVTVDLGKAIETPVVYTITFNSNGGTGTMADVTDISGEYTLPANGFTAPAGKQFKAWSVGGVEKAAGDKITVTANTTVTAVWEAVEYNVTVTGGTASVGAGTPITKATMGTTVTLTANAAPTDMVFDKWEVISGSITLADANSATTTFTMPAGAVSVKATYTTYITVNLAAGEGSGTMEPIIIKNTYGYFSLTAPECTFTAPANKVFDKWQFSKDDSYLKPGDTKTIWSSADGATLTAIWKDAPVTEYDITVTDGKATVGAGTPITKATMGTTVTLTAGAAPSGKVFDEWKVVSGGITLADANSATTTFTMPASAVSVKATYKNAPHTHTYNQETVKPEALKTPADCTRNAVYFKSCSCGAISTTDTFVAMDTALGHAYGSDWKYDSTNHWHECSRCHDKKYEAAHSAGEWIVDTPATATTAGTKHKECTVCKKVLETATIPATGSSHTHSYGTDWKYDNTNHWHECQCGDKADIAAHSASEWIIDTAATETAEGAKHKECTVCKKVLETATIPATGSSHTHSGVYVGMTYTAGNLIYQITSIDTATLGQSKVIGVVAAKKNKITKVTIPDRADYKGYRLNVTAVGDNAFKSMKKLKNVTFGSNVKVIGKNAFSNCKKLNKISFKNITTIGNNAFAGCKALKKLTIGNKVTVIGKNAFKDCSKLETVVIGKAVKTISSKAFIGDNKIKEITFKGKKLKTVKKDAFSNKAKKNIKSKKTKLKGNKKAIKLFKKKLKIK